MQPKIRGVWFFAPGFARCYKNFTPTGLLINDKAYCSSNYSKQYLISNLKIFQLFTAI